MKYIVLKVTDASGDGSSPIERELPILFPEALVHADVASAVNRVLRSEQPDGRKRVVSVASAGFFSSMELDGINFHGESVSIGVKSRGPKDSELLPMLDYTHGIV